MLLRMYVVYDSKAEIYTHPSFLPTRAVAVRQFAELVNDGKHEFSRHPEDYSLFELGTFDDGSGLIAPTLAPIHCCGAIDMLEKKS